MQQHHKAGWTFGAIGFILGALISGTAVEAFRYPAALFPPQQSEADHVPTATAAARTFPQRIVLNAVKADQLSAAVETMGVDKDGQHLFRADVEAGKYRLLWLTLWDWDARDENDGDTISINSDSYRRAVKLRNHRFQIAIPEPKSGYIELRGEETGDGIFAVSVLSGGQPIALPHMGHGQSVKLDIVTP
jgi:hypothetical protein